MSRMSQTIQELFFPEVVGQAVESVGRQERIAGARVLKFVFGPASEFAGEGCFKVSVAFVEARAELSGSGGNRGNQDGAVVESGREPPMPASTGGAKGLKARMALLFSWPQLFSLVLLHSPPFPRVGLVAFLAWGTPTFLVNYCSLPENTGAK